MTVEHKNRKSETGYVNIASTWESSFGAVFNIPWKEITWDIGLEQNYRAIPDTVPYSGTTGWEPSSTYRDTTAYFWDNHTRLIMDLTKYSFYPFTIEAKNAPLK